MATDVTALKSAIALVVDAAKDVVAVLQPGQSPLAKILDCKNLVGDLTTLLPQVGQIPAEIKALQPSDAVVLVDELVASLAISSDHAKGIVDAVLKLLSDLALVIVPDAEALVAAIKAPSAAASAPAAS